MIELPSCIVYIFIIICLWISKLKQKNNSRRGHTQDEGVFRFQQNICNQWVTDKKILFERYGENDKRKLYNQIKTSLMQTDFAQNNGLETLNLINKTVWNQSKYNDNILFMAPIYITCVNTQSLQKPMLGECMVSTNYSIHCVFRIKKCRKNSNISESNCCMIFIDEEAQVYQNWNEYKAKNSLPEGYIIAPENGIYSLDDDNNVKLENFPSSYRLSLNLFYRGWIGKQFRKLTNYFWPQKEQLINDCMVCKGQYYVSKSVEKEKTL